MAVAVQCRQLKLLSEDSTGITGGKAGQVGEISAVCVAKPDRDDQVGEVAFGDLRGGVPENVLSS
ncbi:hypothetical protein ADL15_47930 [Actinoplanes awajinensis subsp. mycoplanecinus]|uniref:Uncharacterized protein n=1 Tax=Actinoplanes awajinensis subsp. mycoplanecinus TaxID=135947 RepID=A0A117MKS5_9ACTN|nr:hypothetical protein ADL15_47930 [Actinoplanes awajinensis subsp. mycoplanecinus]